MRPVPCPHCDSPLGVDELDDGWCENCGKEIPGFVLKAAGGPAAIAAAAGANRSRRLGARKARGSKLDSLAEALSDPLPHVRFSAAQQLGRLGPAARPIAEQLRRLATLDPDTTVREAASESLTRVAPELVPPPTQPVLDAPPVAAGPITPSNPRPLKISAPGGVRPRSPMGRRIGVAVALVILLTPLILIEVIAKLMIGRGGLVLDLGGIVVMVFSGTIIWKIRRGALRARALRAWEIDHTRAPVLFLRAFTEDNRHELNARESEGSTTTLEAFLAYYFGAAGPVIAVGRPGERLPPLGGARVYLGDDWQTHVREFVEAARWVVMFVGPMNPGLAWEVDLVFRLAAPEKFVLIVPPGRDDVLRNWWEAFRGRVGERLPPYQGGELVVTFSHTWGANVSRVRTGFWRGGRSASAYRAALRETLGPLGPTTPATRTSRRMNVQGLISALDSPRVEIRWDAATKLGEMGAWAVAAIPKLKTLLNDPDSMVREAVKEAIQAIEGVKGGAV